MSAGWNQSAGRGEAAASAPDWLRGLRRAALERFEKLGFPTLQDEDWRFTNVSPIAALALEPAPRPACDGRALPAREIGVFADLPGPRLVFVDGYLCPELCAGLSDGLPGVEIDSLAAVLENDADRVQPHLGRHVRAAANPFVELNTAWFRDGAWIRVQPGADPGVPIRVYHVFDTEREGAAVSPRHLIVAGAGSRLTLIESYLGSGRGRAARLTNAVTELVAEPGAVVEHVKFQDEHATAFHLGALYADLARDSRVMIHSMAMGARLSRYNLHLHLGGEHVECVLNGLYLTRGEQLADHHMVVEHAQPHCASHEYFNGILDDRSKGVFHGRILVQPLAQKTDAKQTNKNLLLSDQATIDTKPQLEIYADDVKCTHGATVGQLNADAIFYLRARGLSRDAAQRMLMHAFAGEIVERIRCAPVREELDRLVWDRLEAHERIAVDPKAHE